MQFCWLPLLAHGLQGIAPELRAELWPLLLGVFRWDSSQHARNAELERLRRQGGQAVWLEGHEAFGSRSGKLAMGLVQSTLNRCSRTIAFQIQQPTACLGRGTPPTHHHHHPHTHPKPPPAHPPTRTRPAPPCTQAVRQAGPRLPGAGRTAAGAAQQRKRWQCSSQRQRRGLRHGAGRCRVGSVFSAL